MVTFLNMSLSRNGISSDLSPASIILGSPNKDYNKLNITFCSYAQVYIGNTDITKQRTVLEIALLPENEQSGHYFMSTSTVENLHIYIWTDLSITEQVIQMVDKLFTKEKQPDITKGYHILIGLQEFQSWNKQTVNQKIRMHHFKAITELKILQNISKKKNTLEISKIATHEMGILKK